MNDARKPREFWIGLDENGFARWLSEHDRFAFIYTEGYTCKENLKVREVLPGEPDYKDLAAELAEALNRFIFCAPTRANGEFDSINESQYVNAQKVLDKYRKIVGEVKHD